MTDSMRQYAKTLGLRCRNKRGRLLFEKKGPVHRFWNDVLKVTNPKGDSSTREPFDRVTEVVDTHGSNVWVEQAQVHLYLPGEVTEYPKALCWPRDREEILQICRKMYDRRGSIKASSTRVERTSKRKLLVPSTPDDSDSDELTTSPYETRNDSNGQPVGDSIHTSRDEDDFFLTSVWFASTDCLLSGAITLGTKKTISEFFTAIENSLLKCNDAQAVRSRGALKRIVISFSMNLGYRLRQPRVLRACDDNQPLLSLRRDVFNAFTHHREDMDGEEIICFSTVFFEADALGNSGTWFSSGSVWGS